MKQLRNTKPIRVSLLKGSTVWFKVLISITQGRPSKGGSWNGNMDPGWSLNGLSWGVRGPCPLLPLPLPPWLSCRCWWPPPSASLLHWAFCSGHTGQFEAQSPATPDSSSHCGFTPRSGSGCGGGSRTAFRMDHRRGVPSPYSRSCTSLPVTREASVSNSALCLVTQYIFRKQTGFLLRLIWHCVCALFWGVYNLSFQKVSLKFMNICHSLKRGLPCGLRW